MSSPDYPDQRPRGSLRIAIGSDRAGFAYKRALETELRRSPQVGAVLDVGVDERARTAYPLVALAAGQLITEDKADRALLVCHTGLGMAIAANKVAGVRAVTAHDPYSVRHAVLHNDAQVLALGAGIVGLAVARQLVAAWLNLRFDPRSSAAAKVALLGRIAPSQPLAAPHGELPPADGRIEAP
ncbi:RpiB/LacA/LacB family sugar-phosphate isomerase [Streptomyces sp. NPDC053427]|uniref:RpiB/LacA/LacB family sugar-phosphate isomerase n=1 Tax=Streptomyces sp. NPDC053427 TaxID=3365701 RepID=UPI0037D16D96